MIPVLDQTNDLFNEEIQTPLAWSRSSIKDRSWLIDFPAAVIEELLGFVTVLRENPMQLEAIDTSDYDFSNCLELMRHVKEQLVNGMGLVVLNKLPITTLSKNEMKQIYWVLSGMIERPVAQSFDGRLLYDVIDTGKKIGVRTRGDLTNQELSWHTDYGFNLPPPFIGRFALKTAPQGGVSRVASMLNAHNLMFKMYPDFLRRLYQPFWWNRQGEHPVGDNTTHFFPIFSKDGNEVRGQYIKWLLYKGYELKGVEFDELGQSALEKMFDIMSDPNNHITFDLEPGQIQYINNFSLAHSRTEYADSNKTREKRHLVRIFLRDRGRRSYMG